MFIKFVWINETIVISQLNHNIYFKLCTFQEDGPTIHELAHDDLIQSEGTPDALPGFVTVEIPSMTNANPSHSPGDPSASMYHVTMEDGDDPETGNA